MSQPSKPDLTPDRMFHQELAQQYERPQNALFTQEQIEAAIDPTLPPGTVRIDGQVIPLTRVLEVGGRIVDQPGPLGPAQAMLKFPGFGPSPVRRWAEIWTHLQTLREFNEEIRQHYLASSKPKNPPTSYPTLCSNLNSRTSPPPDETTKPKS